MKNETHKAPPPLMFLVTGCCAMTSAPSLMGIGVAYFMTKVLQQDASATLTPATYTG